MYDYEVDVHVDLVWLWSTGTILAYKKITNSTSAFCGRSNLYRSCFVSVSLKYLCKPLAVSEETPVLFVNKTILTDYVHAAGEYFLIY